MGWWLFDQSRTVIFYQVLVHSQIQPVHQEQSCKWEDSVAETQCECLSSSLCSVSFKKIPMILLQCNSEIKLDVSLLHLRRGIWGMQILSISVDQFNGISHKCTQIFLIYSLTLNCLKEQLSHYSCNIWKVVKHCYSFLWVFTSKPPCWQ